MRWQINEERCRTLHREVDLELVRRHLCAMEQICAGNPKGGALSALELTERFRWLTAHRSTIIQCSAVHPGLCESPEDVLNKLFEKLIL